MKKFKFILGLLGRESSQRFIPEIDALRFFAIVPVLLMHFGTAMLDENAMYDRNYIDQTNALRTLLMNGGQGVILFFAISGFILAFPFLGKSAKELHFKSYFIRRLIRIEPPYIIALTLFLIVHIILNQEGPKFLIERYVYSLFYLHNQVFSERSYILPVAWSLEIEVQFYLLMPLFLYLLCFLNSKFWRFGIYLLVFLIFMRVDLLPYYDLSDFLYSFIPGIAAADIYKHYRLERHWIWDCIFVVSLPWFFLSEGIISALPLFLLILASLHLKNFQRLFTSKIITVVGGMCYSLYLLHYPLFFLMARLLTDKLTLFNVYEIDYLFQALIFIPLSVGIIALYFLFVERPYMILSKKAKRGLTLREITSSFHVITKVKTET